MGLGFWLKSFAFMVVVLAIICNLPADLLLPAESAKLNDLADAPLYRLDDSYLKIRAGDLWKYNGAVVMVVRRPGCLLCREEAEELSKLKPKLSARGVNLYAVLHEAKGSKEFQQYFKGELYLDSSRSFYGPKERWMSWWGFLRLGVWTNILRARSKNINGNMEGEGRLLGGVFVLAPGDQGILFQHHESEWGHHANASQILNAVERIVPKNQSP